VKSSRWTVQEVGQLSSRRSVS